MYNKVNMRLTALLFFRKKLPRGHIFQGKHRIVKEVDKVSLRRLRHDYEREENNMLLLRHPYLTLEQSFCHMKALRKIEGRKVDWQEEKIKKFTKVTTLEDRLMHLNTKDAWD